MGGNPKATFEKRRKEMKRKQNQKEKAAKQMARKDEKSKVGPHPAGEDPDLAGLVPGPNQPPPDEA
ncbi:MAG: hypothetical protein A2638_01265 [Nitrospirae bacterium RIFCSPHIGHO2_01_FULL_66_17]|nr:MAG: hypothetical protein A2638_01265 [Nitrospirae bacterium RIFCSPHIGHO2_01_FULL_66_17]